MELSFLFCKKKEELKMLGTIGGILVIIGSTVKAIDDLTKNN